MMKLLMLLMLLLLILYASSTPIGKQDTLLKGSERVTKSPDEAFKGSSLRQSCVRACAKVPRCFLKNGKPYCKWVNLCYKKKCTFKFAE